eukprot:TRINITY_DN10212_c0_g1_i2.p1 TRINITY_DN10212_c0_g1~~TRINITY_DN10212_c0_g1_i2.p1  ORF type:complete len:485 (+),score=54.93 TRINITY_DN10212_c0_g1_i2:60-1514(+)
MATPPLLYRDSDERSFLSDLISEDTGSHYPQKLVFDWKSFLVSGGGFMLDQYNLFIIGTAVMCMSLTPSIGPFNAAEGSASRSIKLIGAMVGQISFGIIADKIGRKIACFLTLMLVVIGAMGSSQVSTIDTPFGSIHIYWVLCLWQLILGIGVGGEYPLSASMSRESGSDLRHVGLTFCMQGVGFLLSPTVMICLLWLFPNNTDHDLNNVWRYALGFSALPAALLLVPRYKMHDMDSFEKVKYTSRFDKPLQQLLGKTSFRRLVGTAGTWFLFDVSFYGNSILATQAFSTLGISSSETSSAHDQLLKSSWCLLVIAALGLPGYIVAVTTLPKIGLRNMQVLGFFCMTVIFAILATRYHQMSSELFVFLYGLTFFFSNFGPNFTTFILPAVLFDTAVRARCHGISAAAGKLGGAFGVYFLSNIMSEGKANSLPTVCATCCAVSAMGLLLTIMCIDSNPEAVARSFDRKEQRAFIKNQLANYGTVC